MLKKIIKKNSFWLALFCLGAMRVSTTKTGDLGFITREKTLLNSDEVQKGTGPVGVFEMSLEEVKTRERILRQQGSWLVVPIIIDVTYYIIDGEKYIDARDLFDRVEKERGFVKKKGEKRPSGADLMEFDGEIVYRSALAKIPNRFRPLVKVHPQFGGRNMIHVSIPLGMGE